MKRREFLKGAGVLAAAAAGGNSLVYLGGCGSSPAPLDKLPFDAMETLDSIRAKIAHNGFKFSVGRTEMYTHYRDPSLGTVALDDSTQLPPAGTLDATTDLTLSASASFPSRFDLRNVGGRNYLPPIKNQGFTCQCWAFAATDAAAGAHNWRNGLWGRDAVSLSPMYLKWALGSVSPYSFALAAGGPPDPEALQALTRYGNPGQPTNGLEGACREVDFPFAEYEDCMGNVTPPRYLGENALTAPRIVAKRAGRIFPSNWRDTTAHIKAALMRYGPVTSGLLVNAANAAYVGGVYEDTCTTVERDPYYNHVGHAVTLVGWDDYPPEGGGGCWILRNEWGTGWGEDGYMRIRYFSAWSNFAACFIEASGPGDGEALITGTIRGTRNTWLTVSAVGPESFAAVSGDSGVYRLPGLSDGRYRVTPTAAGRTFNPTYRDVEVAGGDVTGIDFDVY